MHGSSWIDKRSSEVPVPMKVEIACGMLDRLRGLLGRDHLNGVLLLAPCNDIHTFGMRHPIDVAFLALDGTVLEVHRDVPPHRRLRCRAAVATIERFSHASPWLAAGDAVGLEREEGLMSFDSA